MDDQRIVAWPPFDLVDSFHRVPIRHVRGDAVNRLGWHDDEPPVSKDLGGFSDVLGSRLGDLHAIALSMADRGASTPSHHSSERAPCATKSDLPSCAVIPFASAAAIKGVGPSPYTRSSATVPGSARSQSKGIIAPSRLADVAFRMSLNPMGSGALNA